MSHGGLTYMGEGMAAGSVRRERMHVLGSNLENDESENSMSSMPADKGNGLGEPWTIFPAYFGLLRWSRLSRA